MVSQHQHRNIVNSARSTYRPEGNHSVSTIIRPFVLLITATLLATSCGSTGDTEASTSATTTDSTEATGATDTPTEATTVGLDVGLFLDGALTEEPATIDCTPADGTESSCYQLTVAGFPANRDSIGPWCPETTSDAAVGIWFDGNNVYDIDGQFIDDLAEIYGDPTWKLYDEDGSCGGHVNPQEGYRMHATTGCSDSTGDVPDDETAMFGYALDGYAIHGPYDESTASDSGGGRAPGGGGGKRP